MLIDVTYSSETSVKKTPWHSVTTYHNPHDMYVAKIALSVRHSFGKQPHRRALPDIQHGDLGFQLMLKTEFSKFLTMIS
jgi:hypothetical protein